MRPYPQRRVALELEEPHVSDGNPRPLALVTIVIGLLVAACGGSSGPAPTTGAATASPTSASVTAPSAAPVPSLTGTAAPLGCPTAAVVGTVLGDSLSAPVGVPGGGGETLPAGAAGIACEYHGAASNVIIELITNIDPSFISKYSDRFPTPYASLAGVGDQARSFRQSLNAGKDNEGVVATKGSTLVDVTATATPASLAQVGALVSQLL